MQILNIERKKIIPLTNIEYTYIYIYISRQIQENRHICRKTFEGEDANDKK